jgi:hypothetical protein
MIRFALALAVMFVIATLLHGSTRRFVRERLRYVDAVQGSRMPWVAGLAAALIAAPFAWLVPFVAAKGLALTAGLAVGMGVAAGARDIRQGTAPVPWSGS